MRAGSGAMSSDRGVIEILVEQHKRIRELLTEIGSGGSGRKRAFEDLRVLLISHEQAEEAVIRPVSRRLAGPRVAGSRSAEEERASGMLAELSDLGIGSAEFDTLFARFEEAVVAHLSREETEEFPLISAGRAAEELVQLGQRLLWSQWGQLDAAGSRGPERAERGVVGVRRQPAGPQMQICTGLTLLAAGAILCVAVSGLPSFINGHITGLILMVTGAAWLWIQAGNGWLFRGLELVRVLSASIGEQSSRRVPLAVLLSQAGQAAGELRAGE